MDKLPDSSRTVNITNLTLTLQDLNLNKKKKHTRKKKIKNLQCPVVNNNVNNCQPCTETNPLLRAIMLAAQSWLTISEPQDVVQQPSLLLEFGHQWTPNQPVVQYIDLQPNDSNFLKIQARFPSKLKVLHVQEVNNPFLKASFELNRHYKYKDRTPLTLFHGTKLQYVNNICTFNFDWRLWGAVKGHKYGKGVNFSWKPSFAANFCEKNVDVKVIIVTDVLLVHAVVGSQNMELPPDGCDSSAREDCVTIVKYNDGEFCPRFVVFFS